MRGIREQPITLVLLLLREALGIRGGLQRQQAQQGHWQVRSARTTTSST